MSDKRPRSVPVPRLYKVAANVYREFNEGKDSVKNLVYEARKKHPNIKAINALVLETLNHKILLDAALEKTEFFSKEPRFQKDLAYILFTELFFGKKILPGDSVPINTALLYQNKIKKHLEGEVNLDKERDNYKYPKYTRVNTLCNSLVRVSRALREDGWLEVMYDKETVSYKEFLTMIKNLKENEFLVDYHIPNLIVFPPKAQLYDHHLIQDGSLLMQDKASCMPITALSPPPGSCVMDACAAPGMKTSQLASMVCGNWVAVLGGNPPPGAKVYAVERNTRRCQILNDILVKSKADKVTTVINQNFLDINPEEYSDVEYVIVDPSCSGDGMVNRNSMVGPVSEEKLQQLVFFQKKILSHALTFPSAKKVVYSTCTLTQEEDEGVIEEVLANNYHWKLTRALDSWEGRGIGEDYSNCVRTDPQQDLCNGFFVSVLERCSDEELKLKNPERKIKRDKNNVTASESITENGSDDTVSKSKKKKKKDKIKESESITENGTDDAESKPKYGRMPKEERKEKYKDEYCTTA